MIRKIFLSFVVAFLVFWLTGAYLMKSKVRSFIDQAQTDNIKLTHSGMGIAGFPFNWKVNVYSPKISFLDDHSSVEIESQDAEFIFSFGLKKTCIDLGQNFYFHHVTGEESTKYIAKSTDKLILHISTDRRIYEIDDHKDAFYDVIDNSHLEDELISVFEQENDNQESEVFTIKDFAISLQKQSNEIKDNILLTLKGNYNSDTRFFEFKSSSIDAKVKYYLDDSNNETKEYDRMIDIQKFYMDFDDAFLDSKGTIKLLRTDIPSGQFVISMKYYNRIINMLVPNDFILSKDYIKKIISKAVMNSGNGNGNEELAKFEVKFSNQGVSVGKLKM